MATTEVNGTCDPRFEPVRDAIKANLVEGLDVGVSMCAYIGDEVVLDLWGGHVDAARSEPWGPETLVNVWSSSKGIVAICAAMLVSRGELDVDQPIASYWPEFKAAGKGEITVRMALTHRAGLPGIDHPALEVEALADWDLIVSLLAQEEPWWIPGKGFGYHAFTYGYLVGEVVRRITGRTIGQFVREELAAPLDADFWFGIPASEHRRIAPVIKPPPALSKPMNVALQDPNSMTVRVLSNPPVAENFEVANETWWRQAEIPAANGTGNGRSLAKIYRMLAARGTLEGREYLRPEILDDFSAAQHAGVDEVTRTDHVVATGFLRNFVGWFQPGSNGFGHAGAGGSMGFVDPDHQLAVGYAMNRMLDDVPDPRLSRVIPALYQCL